MEINSVGFGNFSIGAKSANAQKNDEKQEAPKASVSGEQKSIDSEALFNAMNIAGLQNKVQISQTGRKEINPSDYLDENRIADIEAMMGEFENGVDARADILENEFPGFFADDTKYALAARMFAAE